MPVMQVVCSAIVVLGKPPCTWADVRAVHLVPSAKPEAAVRCKVRDIDVALRLVAQELEGHWVRDLEGQEREVKGCIREGEVYPHVLRRRAH